MRRPVAIALVLGVLALAAWLAARTPPAPSVPAAPPATPPAGPAFALHLYEQPGNDLRVLEVRPLSRTIGPWRIALPAAERDALVDFRTGPPGGPPQGDDEDAGRFEARLDDPGAGELWMVGADTPIGPGRSAYLGLRRRPSMLHVGARGEPLQPVDPARLTRR